MKPIRLMIPIMINKRLLLLLSGGFILATVIGTLSHELGHYTVAELLGYDATINYGSTSWQRSSPGQTMKESDAFWMLLGGPLQTMITGTAGLAVLFLTRRRFSETITLSAVQWTLIYISLFWLRQTANFCVWIGTYFINGKFSMRSDETRLAYYLQIPTWTISVITAIMGLAVLAIVFLKFIPLQHRFTFLVSGLIGGVSGYILWLHLLGPVLMP